MWRDPIVEEVRQARREYAERVGNDIESLVRDLKEKQKRTDRKVVSFPPRSPSRKTDAA
ncbi:MAG: hypothetical protein Q8P50_18990 [Bacillota bacterium]|nr:hypothetical protein [Bacillota bacterium]